MNYEELRALGLATGGDLPEVAYVALCEEIGANPAKGVTKALLLTMYTDAGLGDAHRDHNMLFGPLGWSRSQTMTVCCLLRICDSCYMYSAHSF